MSTTPLTWTPTWVRSAASTLARTRYSWWTRYMPIGVGLLYLNLTIALYAFGPWWYPVIDDVKLYGYVGAAHLCLLLGYVSAAGHRARGYRGRFPPRRLLAIAVFCQLAVLLPTALFRTGSVLPDLGAALLSPGEAYGRSYLVRQEGLPVVEYVRIALGPVLAMLLPLLVCYWKQANRASRWLGAGSLAGVVLTYISMGTNKALGDTLLLTPFLFAAGHFAGRVRFSRWQKAATLAVLVAASILFFLFFSAGMRTRAGSMARNGYISPARARADWGHPLLQAVPAGLEVGVLGVTAYLTNGYFGLALALEQPFVPMYGVGHSRFLTRQAARILDNSAILHLSYPERVQAEVGWDSLLMWATIYPWLASDLTFPGALLFVFFAGRRLAESWLDTLRGENPWAPVMLAQLVIMVFYFNASNPNSQDGEGLAAFWVTYFAWRRTRA